MATHNTEFFPGAASLFLLFSMGYADGNSPTLTQEKIRRGKSVAFLKLLTFSLVCYCFVAANFPAVVLEFLPMKEELHALIRKEICCQWAIPRVLSRRTVLERLAPASSDFGELASAELSVEASRAVPVPLFDGDRRRAEGTSASSVEPRQSPTHPPVGPLRCARSVNNRV